MIIVLNVCRSHTVLGRVTLAENIEDVAMSLDDSPVFFNAKEGIYPVVDAHDLPVLYSIREYYIEF